MSIQPALYPTNPNFSTQKHTPETLNPRIETLLPTPEALDTHDKSRRALEEAPERLG